MILDASALENDTHLEADVCVIGAGPAAISVARVLAEGGRSSLMLAGGNLEPCGHTSTLAVGTVEPDTYFPLDECRVRAFGGTTHVWGGWSRLIDAVDMEPRDCIAHSGWPISHAELAVHSGWARKLCGLPVSGDPVPTMSLSTPAAALRIEHRDVEQILFALAPNRFAALHHEYMAKSTSITLVLGGHTTKLVTDSSGHVVKRVLCASSPSRRFTVSARDVIIAAGGIENPRLMLVSEGHGENGLGNSHGNVGRFFGDHLHVPVGLLHLRSQIDAAFFQPFRVGALRVRGGLTLTDAARRHHRLLGSAVTLHNADDPHDLLSPARWKGGYASLSRAVQSIRRGKFDRQLAAHALGITRHPYEAAYLAWKRVQPIPLRRMLLGLRCEQEPSSQSRVTLDDRLDAFGMPRARLRWHVSDRDLMSVEETIRVLSRALRAARPEMFPRDGDSGWVARLQPAAHHMGTTRMSRSPTDGVVDVNCRVHGTTNLYVAGSSVFPTGGWAPPTLTIIALAVRLARHLVASARM